MIFGMFFLNGREMFVGWLVWGGGVVFWGDGCFGCFGCLVWLFAAAKNGLRRK